MKEFRPSSMSKLEIRRFKNICLISSESKLQYIQWTPVLLQVLRNGKTLLSLWSLFFFFNVWLPDIKLLQPWVLTVEGTEHGSQIKLWNSFERTVLDGVLVLDRTRRTFSPSGRQILVTVRVFPLNISCKTEVF